MFSDHLKIVADSNYFGSLFTAVDVLGEARVGAVRLPGWDPQDTKKQRLEIIGDMAQWRSCIRNLSSSVWFFNLLFCSPFFTIPRSFV